MRKPKAVKFRRKPALTPHQQQEARKRLAEGETQRSVARSYNVKSGDDFEARSLTTTALLARYRPVRAVRKQEQFTFSRDHHCNG
jgi:hypothetical protein